MAATDRLPSATDAFAIITELANGDVPSKTTLYDQGLGRLQDLAAFLLMRVRRLDDATTIRFAYSTTNTLSLSVASGLAVGDPFFASTSGTLPTGMAVDTVYYVKTITGVEESATMTISTSYGGAALAITGAGTGNHDLTPLRPYVDRGSLKREYDVPDTGAATLDPVLYGVFRLPATHTTNPNLYTLPNLTVGSGLDGRVVTIYRNIATTGTARILRADATIMATYSSTTPEWADYRWDDGDTQWRVVRFGPNITIAEV
mgnify:CR=1 FL=1